jgi:hypothetical protein
LKEAVACSNINQHIASTFTPKAYKGGVKKEVERNDHQPSGGQFHSACQKYNGTRQSVIAHELFKAKSISAFFSVGRNRA